MQTRVASGPPGDPAGLKAALLSEPSIVEKGFRILDADLCAGTAGAIDLIGIDRAGALALIVIAADDPGASLLRLLDQYAWITEQRGLLERIYGGSGLAPALPVRCLLLAPGFTHAFLRRLSLLSVEVFPYLARRARARGGSWLVEPAAPIFGYGMEEPVLEADVAPSRPGEAEGPPAPPIEAEADAAGRPALIAFEDAPPAIDPIEPLPGLPAESGAGPGEALETLTAEELEEFERFDRKRREGQRRSP